MLAVLLTCAPIIATASICGGSNNFLVLRGGSLPMNVDNLLEAAKDPEAAAELERLMQDPQAMQEIKAMMDDPEFRAQMMETI